MEGTIAVVILAFVAGVVLGAIYGRRAEQKAVAAVFEEFSKADVQAHELVSRIATRLTFWRATH